VLPVKKRVALQHKEKRKGEPKMATKQEEEDEQTFFAEKVSEQTQHERKDKMAEKHDEPKPRDSTAGYSGSQHEGKKFERPKDASKDAVVSDAGVTEPTIEFGGDGVTPKAEWEKKHAEQKKAQDAHDEKMRQKVRDEAGPMLKTGTEKEHKNG
jgi:hypothetical protein